MTEWDGMAMSHILSRFPAGQTPFMTGARVRHGQHPHTRAQIPSILRAVYEHTHLAKCVVAFLCLTGRSEFGCYYSVHKSTSVSGKKPRNAPRSGPIIHPFSAANLGHGRTQASASEHATLNPRTHRESSKPNQTHKRARAHTHTHTHTHAHER